MNPDDFINSSAGKCIKTTEGYWAFVPSDLPPKIKYDKNLSIHLSDADRALSELSGTSKLIPNPYRLISPYIRREAVSSSRIEGTQASISDLFFYESSQLKHVKDSDVKEVHNYVKAIEHGIERLKELPISIRLIREIHGILMKGVRGSKTTPGELRKIQNWIGAPNSKPEDSVYVPPPVYYMKEALYNWEKYLHEKADEPLLIQCALMHYQFEAVHPFLDGNGRLGRLLITFFLIERGYLEQPLLYISEYFERNREKYYEHLLNVSGKGDWYGWVLFFLKGIAEQSKDALIKADKILRLYDKYMKDLKKTKKIPESAHKLIDEIFKNPFVSISNLSKEWDIPYNSVKTGVKRLEELEILVEIPDAGKEVLNLSKSSKMFVAKDILELSSLNR